MADTAVSSNLLFSIWKVKIAYIPHLRSWNHQIVDIFGWNTTETISRLSESLQINRPTVAALAHTVTVHLINSFYLNFPTFDYYRFIVSTLKQTNTSKIIFNNIHTFFGTLVLI